MVQRGSCLLADSEKCSTLDATERPALAAAPDDLRSATWCCIEEEV